MKRSTPTFNTVSGGILLFGLVAGLFLVFRLPWGLAINAPVKSESYALGFHNQVAVFGLILCIAACGTALLMRQRHLASDGVLGWIRPPGESPSLSRWGWFFFAAFCLFEVVLLLGWNLLSLNPYWGEAAYFLSRVDLVALGYTPYQDFQHLYGPLLLYFPVWLDRISLGAWGLEMSYAMTLALNYLAGNFLLLIFLCALKFSEGRFLVVFTTALLLFLPLTMGLNYTPLRFALVPGLLASVYFLSGVRWAALWKNSSLFLLSAAGILLAFGISPEMGVALSLGLAGFALPSWMGRRSLEGTVVFGGAMVGIGAVVGLFRGEYLHGILAVQGGGNNFPIYPNLHNLLYLVALLGVFPALGCAALVRPGDPRSSLGVAFCLSGGVLIAAALGRCDPGHVFLNGLIPLLVMLVAAGSFHRILGTLFFLAFLLAVAGNFFSYFNHYHVPLSGVFAERKVTLENPAVRAGWAELWASARRASPAGSHLNWKKPVPISPEMVKLVASEDFVMAGFFDLGLDRLLKLKPDFAPDYHPLPVSELYSPRDVERAVSDLLRRPAIWIPASLVNTAHAGINQRAYQEWIDSFLSGLMLFPVRSRIRNEPYAPDREVIRQLLNSCQVSPAPIEGLVILRPTANSIAR